MSEISPTLKDIKTIVYSDATNAIFSAGVSSAGINIIFLQENENRFIMASS